jgi:hypothetical protein
MTSVTVQVVLPKLPPKAVKEFLRGVAESAVRKLTAEAQKQIRSMDARKAYANSLNPQKYPRVIEVGNEKATVTLVSPQQGLDPNALESGSGPWDMKPGLLKHGDGKYKDINFRHGAPGSAGGYFQPVPKGIFEEMISKAKAASSQRAAPPKGPEKILGPPRVAPQTKTLPTPGVGPFAHTYSHKKSIYSDMMKMSQEYEKAKGSQYVTIRRVSKKSEPSSWIHPGWKALHLFELVAKEIEKEASKKAIELLKVVGVV